jgi:dipeptidyl aminopeptidase/acylaminoacyl peptidase
MELSRDGRFAAYLYRPCIERRHGNDLWLYDTTTGDAVRITKVSVMSKFQESARKVKEDRIKKAKEKGIERAPVAPPKDDAVTGTWDGTMTAPKDSGLIVDGLSITLKLRLNPDKTVTGTLKSLLLKATLSSGVFVTDDGLITAELHVTDSQLTGKFRANVQEDKSLKGTIELEGFKEAFEFTAKRTGGIYDDDIQEEKNEEEHSETKGETTTDDKTEDQQQDEKQEQTPPQEKDDSKSAGEADGDAKRTEGDSSKKEKRSDDELADVVTDKDADEETAPRYNGINRFEWSPLANELIFVSEGDLYRLNAETGEIIRLSRTAESEGSFQYLPDGSGFLVERGGSIHRIRFNNTIVEELNPKLPDGESVSDFEISPDGTRLAILSSKGQGMWNRGRTVNIVNYRDRFAQVSQVSRHVPDDPLGNFEWSVHLFDTGKHMTEEGLLKKVYTHKQSGPRDIMRAPQWSPDSTRAAWAVFEQSTGHVDIMEARFVEKEKKKEDKKKDEEPPKEETVKTEGAAETDTGGDTETKVEDGAETPPIDAAEPAAPAEKEYEIQDARAVYRFLHNGGPNTPRMIEPQYLPDSKRMVFITELSGFRQLHVLDPVYEQLTQLTHGKFEVYPFDISEDHARIFALATKDDPAQQHVFSVDVESGELTRLSPRDGFYDDAAVSDDGQHMLANFVDFGSPVELVAVARAEGGQPGAHNVLTDSHPKEAHKLTEWAPTYFTFENRHGQAIHGHMFKPDDWAPEDKRPLLVYVYGGPLGTQKMITRGSFGGPNYRFAYYMAKKHGYVTCTVDPRGASGYGGLFEKSNYEQVGKPQVEDLVDTARWFVKNHGVDEKRMGLHGWSFGGFQTQMVLYTEPDVFACGIAGAGPTEWENYNSWYSTGTIGPSREGQPDLAKFSLLPLAKNLKSRLLLVHGMEDANVLYQDTVRVYRELLKANKETLVELFVDPTGGHGLGGDVKELNRYRKYEEFLVRCLGSGLQEKKAEVESPKEETITEALPTNEGAAPR